VIATRHIWPHWHAESVEQATLERARAGDEQAFRELTDPFRHELLAHCYRMLGSLVDAEDMLQETLLAAWRGLARFEGRSSLRSWLYRIATNTCLNAIRAGSRRVPTEPTPPFQPPEPTQRDEITWLQPYPDSLLDGIADATPGPEARYTQAEAIELAFVNGLQRMPPRQAAAVLLRDVLGFGTDEVAAMLETSHSAVKGTLQRGRAALANSRSDCRLPAPRSTKERELARRFADAYVSADINGVPGCSPTTRGCPCLPRHTSIRAWTRSGPSCRPASSFAANAGLTCSRAGQTTNLPSPATSLIVTNSWPDRLACSYSPWRTSASRRSPASTSTTSIRRWAFLLSSPRPVPNKRASRPKTAEAGVNDT
jgi:RNA polymerase sigma factor (sigma-70 family)